MPARRRPLHEDHTRRLRVLGRPARRGRDLSGGGRRGARGPLANLLRARAATRSPCAAGPGGRVLLPRPRDARRRAGSSARASSASPSSTGTSTTATARRSASTAGRTCSRSRCTWRTAPGARRIPSSATPDELGEGEGEGFNVNVELGIGAGDAAYADAISEIVVPIVRRVPAGAHRRRLRAGRERLRPERPPERQHGRLPPHRRGSSGSWPRSCARDGWCSSRRAATGARTRATACTRPSRACSASPEPLLPDLLAYVPDDAARGREGIEADAGRALAASGLALSHRPGRPRGSLTSSSRMRSRLMPGARAGPAARARRRVRPSGRRPRRPGSTGSEVARLDALRDRAPERGAPAVVGLAHRGPQLRIARVGGPELQPARPALPERRRIEHDLDQREQPAPRRPCRCARPRRQRSSRALGLERERLHAAAAPGCRSSAGPCRPRRPPRRRRPRAAARSGRARAIDPRCGGEDLRAALGGDGRAWAHSVGACIPSRAG